MPYKNFETFMRDKTNIWPMDVQLVNGEWAPSANVSSSSNNGTNANGY